ncbi:Chaperone protein DnaJ [Symbiodinium microadriaticum]|uniref:Chaperone protein DnaJ n=1 Tax=Symbiodinium microadriaticum TaxID=2951 RepID=A0A1Q9F3M0_SYMMI|nr:Chaperone protein DnaJ [Symbiodinium microadriaticum]
MLIVAANFAAYGATTLGETLCCDVALVHASRFVTIAGIRDGTTITMAEKCWACTNMVLCIGLRNGSWRSLGCHVASPGRAIRLRAQRDPTGVAKLFAALQLQRTQANCLHDPTVLQLREHEGSRAQRQVAGGARVEEHRVGVDAAERARVACNLHEKQRRVMREQGHVGAILIQEFVVLHLPGSVLFAITCHMYRGRDRCRVYCGTRNRARRAEYATGWIERPGHFLDTDQASEDDIKKAYRAKSREWHPDKNPDNPQATAMFQRINEAYNALKEEEEEGEECQGPGPRVQPDPTAVTWVQNALQVGGNAVDSIVAPRRPLQIQNLLIGASHFLMIADSGIRGFLIAVNAA